MLAEETRELELRYYLRVLRHRKGIVVASVVLVVAAAVVSSLLQTPVYEASAQLLLQSRSTESLFDPNTGQRSDPVRAVQTEIQVLRSEPVRAAVREKLGGTAPKVSASPVGQTDVIEVKAESISPRRAATVANAYATAYIDFRRKQAVDDLLAAGQQVQAKIADLQRQVDDLDRRVEEAPPPQRPQVAQAVGGERQSLVDQQALFKQKLDQLQVDAALKTGGAQLVTPAAVSTSPVRPTPVRNGVVALVVGLMLGVGLAFLREYLDDTVKSKDDLEAAARGVPMLGLVPRVSGWKNRQEPFVVSLATPSAPAAEAYRSLRTSVQFLGLDRPLRTVQVTSPSASEGKTTTLVNLAVALAQAGQQVVLIDCDLRRPRLHDFFGLDNTAGFTSVLLGEVPLSGALQAVPGQERMRVLTSGPVPPNPSELLSGRRTVELLTTVQADADIVLVDSPPVLPVTDAAVLSNRVDGTLMVATAGATTRKDLQRAVETLQQVSAPLLGIVLNGTTEEGGYGYSYRYAYAETGEGNGKTNGRRGRKAALRR